MREPKRISIVTPCYDEQENVEELYARVRRAVLAAGRYRYEHIFIDNASQDGTLDLLRGIAARDPNVKVIANARNFGHVRSPMHAVLQASGDAVALLAGDLQEPPELITEMIRQWESGVPIVVAIKETSEENRLVYWLRTRYYRLINELADVRTFEHFTGFGLYDRKVIELVRKFDDPYPYFRGQIAEIGLPYTQIRFRQPRRTRGITKNNLYTLYDLAVLGITNFSKVPLRIATFTGFVSSILSLLVGLVYLVYKALFWDRFNVGIAPLVIGAAFLGSLQMLFLGIIGEYVGSIQTAVQKRPLVVERERINFEYAPSEPLADGEEQSSIV